MTLPPSQPRVVMCAAASLGVMYLLLGLVFVIFFILVNSGIISYTYILINLHESYIMLIIVLVIIFLGMLTSIMVIVSVKTENSFFILPWLIFHLLTTILIILSGIAFVLHFIIDKKHFMRAGLCCIPIMTGLMFLFIWVKVYQEMCNIKLREKKRKLERTNAEILLVRQAAFNRSVVKYDKPENIYSQPFDDIEETVQTKPKFTLQAYKYLEPIDNSQPHKAVNNWQTKPSNISSSEQDQFSGVSLTFHTLPYRNSHRKLETLEASITLEEEE